MRDEFAKLLSAIRGERRYATSKIAGTNACRRRQKPADGNKSQYESDLEAVRLSRPGEDAEGFPQALAHFAVALPGAGPGKLTFMRTAASSKMGSKRTCGFAAERSRGDVTALRDKPIIKLQQSNFRSFVLDANC